MRYKKEVTYSQRGWLEEVSRVLLSYHTMLQSITRETPFSLVYGINALISVEPTYRVINFSQEYQMRLGM